MSANVLASINNFLYGSDAVQLRKLQYYVGVLRGVEQAEDIVLASIAGDRIEAPASLLSELQPLVGERVIMASVKGQVRVGRRST